MKLRPVSTCMTGNGIRAGRERLAGDVEHHDRVLAAREQQARALHLGGDLAEDVDALGLEGPQLGHRVGRHARTASADVRPGLASRPRRWATSAGWQTTRSGDHGSRLVVDERRAVEAGGDEARRRARRRPAPPSPTRAGRRRGRRRRPCRRSRATTLTPVEPIGTSSTSGAFGEARRDRRRPAAADRDAQRAPARRGPRARRRRRPATRCARAAARRRSAGSATAPSVRPAVAAPERDVDGEVVAPAAVVEVLAELARAVERVDDPDALRGQPARVVGRLLGQDRVARPGRGQRGREPRLGAGVARAAEVRSAPRRAVRHPLRSASACRRRPRSTSPAPGGQGGGEAGRRRARTGRAARG